MDQTILSGLFALGGAIIGGGVTLIATVISNRKQINLELKKQRIEYLNFKRSRLEEILHVTSKIFYAANVFDNTMNVFLLMRNNSHLISDARIDVLCSSLNDRIEEYTNIAKNSSSELYEKQIDNICIQINDIISDINLIIDCILKDIIQTLEKEIK